MRARQPYASDLLPRVGAEAARRRELYPRRAGIYKSTHPSFGSRGSAAKVRDMRRLFFAPLAALLGLLAPVGSGASVSPTSGSRATTAAVATIKMGGRTGIDGPWRRALRLKLKRGGLPVTFSVCAVWGEPPSLTPECLQTSSERLPEGTMMRLEQHRTVGWKRIGLSPVPTLHAVLSNAVAGNRFGTVFYRVTLRERGSGRILRTSNSFKVVWRK